MVHRLLAASLHLSELPESSKDKMSVHALADNLNTRHRNAQMAGRASVELHTLIYFKDRSILADARITKVSQSYNISSVSLSISHVPLQIQRHRLCQCLAFASFTSQYEINPQNLLGR